MASRETCTACKKAQVDLPEPLKKCAKCKKVYYCSKDCQKTDWKGHKTFCGLFASMNESQAPESNSASQHNPGFQAFSEILGMSGNDYLHSLSEKDAMIQLIDCFRMRAEDEYNFAGDASGLYAGDSPLPPFREFLNLAEKRDGILPKWWNKEKRRECERLAMGGDSWADIKVTVEKSTIQDHYNNSMMPATLRILGEKIYGRGFT